MADAKEAEQTADAAGAVRTLVERTIQRNIKGVEYFASAAPPVGLTPKDTIHKRGTLNLYHYKPLVDEVYRVPILMVMATTNRGYVFDVAEEHSFVRFLLNAGYDVFVMDWDYPRPEEKTLNLDDYASRFFDECIRKVQQASGEKEVSLMGYCMGGVLSTIYAASHPEAPIKNLACFTTPIDFSQMTIFAHMAQPEYFDVDRLVDNVGNVSPELLQTSFDMLRPSGRAASNRMLWDNMWNDDFVEFHRKMDRWANDMLPLAGEYFRDTIKKLMWDNQLLKGTLQVDGRVADLANITIPVFHGVAQHDHIVPYEASKPLIANVGSKDKEEIVMKGGHISLIAGPNAARHLWPALDVWFAERSV
ncbi:alpha/beta fold hydrolase [Erythrobacter ani]|uniref:Alpha/beta fold hydrolase n=1 Tax=Erythrobacter ani TaxID=2827235 RepID=A0ABS6SK48_9SPHN|nr:alpha/beta fold hydrolase [Erythrobacter ani]MBV7265391.1 alpha/beta fold hydrolase [Erythrobacter ani]